MRTKCNRGASSIWIVLILIIVALFGADKFLGLVARNRQQQQQGSVEIRQEASRFARGEAIAKRDFPNTNEGRVSSILHNMLLDAQSRESLLQLGLNRIDWEWVETPEAISSKANLQKSMKIAAQGRKLFERYGSEYERNYRSALRKLKQEAQDNPVAREMLQGMNSKAEKSSAYYWSKKSIAAQMRHIDALEGMTRFLLAKVGKFSVDEEGTVEFSASVSDKEIDAYARLNQVFDETAEQVGQIALMQSKQVRHLR